MNKKKYLMIILIILILISVIKLLYSNFGEKRTVDIEIGDCIEMHFIGRYASNNTIFDSSYEDIENRTGGTPLRIFISFNSSEPPPDGYEFYSSDIIEGLMEGLVGLQKEKKITIGPIPPEKGYGFYPQVGDVINITDLYSGREIQIQFIKIVENLSDREETMFTIRYDRYSLGENITLYPAWENATEVTKINETKIWYYTTPPLDKRENFTWINEGTLIPYWENASNVTFNDSAIVLTHNPSINATMNASVSGYYKLITVTNLTDDTIYAKSTDSLGNISYLEIDRTQIIPRNHSQNITETHSLDHIEGLLEMIKAIYNPNILLSVDELADETLLYEVEIVDIYKTS